MHASYVHIAFKTNGVGGEMAAGLSRGSHSSPSMRCTAVVISMQADQRWFVALGQLVKSKMA